MASSRSSRASIVATARSATLPSDRVAIPTGSASANPPPVNSSVPPPPARIADTATCAVTTAPITSTAYASASCSGLTLSRSSNAAKAAL